MATGLNLNGSLPPGSFWRRSAGWRPPTAFGNLEAAQDWISLSR